MPLSLVMLLGGGVLLYFGAEWLVGGASGLARSLGLPQLLIGLTVVAYGTSAPEIVVSVKASVAGAGGIALGNVVGSNIANLGLILGLTTLIYPAHVDRALARRELPVLALSTLAIPLVLLDGRVERLEGGALVVGALAYSGWMIHGTRRTLASVAADAGAMAAAADLAGAPRPAGRVRMALTALAGLGFLVLGGSLFVDGASGIARSLGLSERLIGLTIVAVGTSLPELATSLIAARRGQSDLAVGNVVGSNIFNALLCLGAAAAVSPIEASLKSMALDLVTLVALTAFAIVGMRKERHIGRREGGFFLAAYLTFMLVLAFSGAES
jgi:cation:H+ antiporter